MPAKRSTAESEQGRSALLLRIACLRLTGGEARVVGPDEGDGEGAAVGAHAVLVALVCLGKGSGEGVRGSWLSLKSCAALDVAQPLRSCMEMRGSVGAFKAPAASP